MKERRRLRSNSDNIRKLVAMVGSSGKIYSNILELCQVGELGPKASTVNWECKMHLVERYMV
jgi:hypothetical protein